MINLYVPLPLYIYFTVRRYFCVALREGVTLQTWTRTVVTTPDFSFQLYFNPRELSQHTKSNCLAFVACISLVVTHPAIARDQARFA